MATPVTGRLLVLNNYPLDVLQQAVARRDAPDHLLFGINQFADAGWEVTILPVGRESRWQQANLWLARSRFPVPLGDLEQQRTAWRCLDECDVIYAACQTQAHTLSYLRACGLVHRPIVVVVHHPVNRGRLAAFREPFLRWQLRGTDRIVSLSGQVANRINEIAPGKAVAVPWGTDVGFYTPARHPGSGALAVGRTGRDFATFGHGATAAGVPSRIVCLRKDVTPEFARFGANVTVDVQPDEGWMGYPALMRHYEAARVVAIPHFGQDSIVGLSTLADALGMGKPVIVTRHPLLDIDVEREGIGRSVPIGDVAAWRDAIAWFEAHPDEAHAMGRRARLLAENRLNSEAFGKQVLAILETVASENNRGRSRR